MLSGKQQYTLTYNRNYSGTDNTTISAGSHTAGTTVQLSSITAVAGSNTNWQRTGYTFLGWSTSRNGSIITNPWQMPSGNTTLYARYRINIYNVTFDLNGGEGTIDHQTLNYGSLVTKPQDPVREGYDFIGWNYGDTEWDFDNNMPARDIMLIAAWEVQAAPPTGTPDTDPKPPIKGPSLSDKDMERLSLQTGNIIVDIIEGNVPLGNFIFEAGWSLLSLLMSAIAIITSIITTIKTFVRNNKDNEKAKSNLLKWIGIAAGVLPLILFIIFDDMSLPLVFVNKFTLYVAIAFAAHIAMLIAARAIILRKENSEAASDVA